MMQDALIPAVAPFPGGVEMQDEVICRRLRIMQELLSSLSASHESLVKLDLNGIEHGTRDQVSLSRKLGENLSAESANVREGSGIAERAPADAGELRAAGLRAAELRQVESQVLQALRLQSALLGRARRKLRILANMLAGPSGNYSAVDFTPSRALLQGCPPPLLRRSTISPPRSGASSGRT